MRYFSLGKYLKTSSVNLVISGIKITFVERVFVKKRKCMRLSRKEIETILKVADEIYGKGVKVYLFGSRTDESKRGGDIDLLLRTPQSDGGILKRIRMVARLKELLGDQKIDIIGDYETSVVAREALSKGILLQ